MSSMKQSSIEVLAFFVKQLGFFGKSITFTEKKNLKNLDLTLKREKLKINSYKVLKVQDGFEISLRNEDIKYAALFCEKILSSYSF